MEQDFFGSREDITHLFGDTDVPPSFKTPHEGTLETIALMEQCAEKRGGEAKRWFPYVSEWVLGRCENLNSEQRREFIERALQFFTQLLEYQNTRFAVHCFPPLFEKEEKGAEKETTYTKAFEFYKIIDGYNEPGWAKNFFPWLYEKTGVLGIEHQQLLVYIAIETTGVIINEVLAERNGSENQLMRVELKPETQLRRELGFSDNDYTALQRNLLEDISKPRLDTLRKAETIADAINYIAKENGIGSERDQVKELLEN